MGKGANSAQYIEGEKLYLNSKGRETDGVTEYF